MTNFEYEKLQNKIKQQESIDLNNCIKFFNYQFEKIEYIIPEDNRSDVNITATTKLEYEIEYNVEIKERNCYFTTFDDTIIEVDKYNYLMSDKNKTNIYYVIYKDCIAVYNLSKIDITKCNKRMQLMNKKTMKDKNDKIYKEVYGLTQNLATTFNKFNYNKIKNANYQ